MVKEGKGIQVQSSWLQRGQIVRSNRLRADLYSTSHETRAMWQTWIFPTEVMEAGAPVIILSAPAATIHFDPQTVVAEAPRVTLYVPTITFQPTFSGLKVRDHVVFI